VIPYKIKLIIAGISVFLLMVPSSSIFADDLSSITPNTIPLWGLTWCQTDITYRIDNAEKITREAFAELDAGIQSWVLHSPDGFTIKEVFAGDPADVIIKFKKGGGKVQGRALQHNDGNGCFTSVKITVSGKAFGQDSPLGQVQSISAQEFGHGLGLLHSDNKADVMYGTVQSSPNTKLSDCDIEAWNEVMDWLIEGKSTPHPPTVSSVSCPDTNGGGPGESTSCVGTIPDGNNLAEKVSKISFDIKSKGRFNDLLITVHVSDSENDVSDALVKLNLCRDGRDQPWQFQGSTDQNGDVTFKLGKARSNTPYSAYIVNDDQFHLTSELCSVAKISSSSVTESAC